VRLRRLDDALGHLRRVYRLDVHLQLARVEVTGEQHVVHDLGQPVCLVGHDVEKPAAHGFVEIDVDPA
jgi:hypothetical protein